MNGESMSDPPNSHLTPCKEFLCISQYLAGGISCLASECDISVSKLLGFETFPFFMILVFVLNFFKYRKKYRFRKKMVLKKVLLLVLKVFGIDKSIGISFEKNLLNKYWN